MRVPALAAILLAVALAGCAGEAPTPDNADDIGTNEILPDMDQEAKVFDVEGTITIAAGTPILSFQLGGQTLDFTVGQNATLLFVEVEWDNDVMDLDLHLKEPGSGDMEWQHSNQNGSPGMPDNPHSITLSNPATGGWQGGVFAQGAAGQVTYKIIATVFYGETEVPDGYSAL